MAETTKKSKVKKPSALKRQLQSEKKRKRNRSYCASVLTSIRSLENALKSKAEPKESKENLSRIYSLMDKGVKKGIYKPQKANRTKSRLFKLCSK